MNRFLRWLFPTKRVHSGHVGGFNSSASPYWKNNLKSERPTMSENTKTRTSKEKLFRVEDGAGRGGFYRATSVTQARSFHVSEITAREATIEEVIDIGKRGLGVGGLAGPSAAEPDPQLDAFSAADLEADGRN